MASVLKRKRGPITGEGEVPDTPKRAKSVNVNVSEKERHPLPTQQTGWDAAFNPPKTELTQTNGEAVEYDNYIAGEDAEEKDEEQERKRKAKEEKRLLKAVRAQKQQAWHVSEPIGGRMIGVDPVFSVDEK
jgi:hypothetical protein